MLVQQTDHAIFTDVVSSVVDFSKFLCFFAFSSEDMGEPRAARQGFNFWPGQEHSHHVQSGPGDHRASYPISIGGSFPKAKAVGAGS